MMPFSPPLRWVDLEAGFGLAITFDLPDFGSQPGHVRGAATRWAMATTPTSRATFFNPGPIDLVGMVVSLFYVSALVPDQLAVTRHFSTDDRQGPDRSWPLMTFRRSNVWSCRAWAFTVVPYRLRNFSPLALRRLGLERTAGRTGANC